MPNVYRDKRECAKQIDRLQQEMAKLRSAPPLEDETEYRNYQWIFGHYDSRGGAILIDKPDPVSAMRHYATEVFDHVPPEDGGDLTDWIWAMNCGYDDLIGRFEVVVVGGNGIPEPGYDCLHGYTDDGYEAYRLHGEYGELDVLVLIAHGHPMIETEMRETYRGMSTQKDKPEGEGWWKSGNGWVQYEVSEELADIKFSVEVPTRKWDQEGGKLMPTTETLDYRLEPWDLGEGAYGLVVI